MRASLLALTVGCMVPFVGACGGQSTFGHDDGGCEKCTPSPDASGVDVWTPSFDDSGIPDGGGGPSDAPFDGKPSALNLIPNGDFEQGNVLFSSEYSYATINTVEGQYTVGTNGQAFNNWLMSTGDHTSTHGQMFIGNGKATPDRVWYTTIAVTPGTHYYFEAWVMNLCCSGYTTPQGPSILSFYANGQLLGTRTSSLLGQWEGLSTEWDSGSATSVDLKLVNANTDSWGNDFAVDDVYLGTVSTVNPPH